MYSARQRDMRERRLHALTGGEERPAEEMTAIEVTDGDADVAVPISMPLRRGATAA